MSATNEQTIVLDQAELLSFCGVNDSKIRRIRQGLDADVMTRGNEIVVSGDPGAVEQSADVIRELLSVVRQSGHPLSVQQIDTALREASRGSGGGVSEVFLDEIPLPNKSRRLSPITVGQKKYVDAIRKADIVFAVGPAGTGKTYLAVAMAVWHLLEGHVRRIILVRPAVEAGERLGFLPGDIAAKFDPFVRPLYDALYDMMEAERIKTYLETGVIEIAPLAFMRGRTLNGAFVILDEGQNTTIAQMKMFLTRLGTDAKAVVTGDVTQIDLPEGTQSGLVHAEKVLHKIGGIRFCKFGKEDVVRHELVQKIIMAYEQSAPKRKHPRG